MSLLEIKNLSTFYNTKIGYNQALEGLSLELNAGEILGLIGESGCGKSTAAFSFMRMIQYPGEIVGGTVHIDGKELLGMDENHFRKVLWKEIAMIPQSAMNALDPSYTVGNQILEAVLLHCPKMTRHQGRHRVEELLSMVGMDPKWYNAYPHKLSGGMKQRVIIAMALSCNPKIIISDEATTGLDVLIEAQILALLVKFKNELGLGIVLISHDLHMITSICDRIGIMYAGHLVEIADAEEIKNTPCHPYTRALFASQIDVSDFNRRVNSIEGSVPRLVNPANQCRFYSRCKQRMEVCRDNPPPALKQVRDGHSVACYLDVIK